MQVRNETHAMRLYPDRITEPLVTGLRARNETHAMRLYPELTPTGSD